MGLFGPSKGTAESAIKFVNEFLAECGLNGQECMDLNDDTCAMWTLQRGSAVLLVMVFKDPEFPFLVVKSPIVKLPANGPHEPVLRYCLEKNTGSLASICLSEDTIEVSSGRPIEGLDKEELDGIVAIVSGVADELDNELADKFGCEMIGEE